METKQNQRDDKAALRKYQYQVHLATGSDLAYIRHEIRTLEAALLDARLRERAETRS